MRPARTESSPLTGWGPLGRETLCRWDPTLPANHGGALVRMPSRMQIIPLPSTCMATHASETANSFGCVLRLPVPLGVGECAE
jgi:hypothetical protein